MLRTGRLGVVLALILLCNRAGGAEIDRYLPADTNGIITLNTGQLIDSPLLQKTYLPLLVKELAAKPDLLKLFRDFQFDPFRDLDRIQIAFADSCERQGGKSEPGFCLIARGNFNLPRVHAHLAALAPHLNKALQIHKSGSNLIYEATAADGRSFFFALPERTTLVFAPRRDYVSLTLDRAAARKLGALAARDVRDLIAKTDGKQAFWLVATSRTTLSFEGAFAAGQPMARKRLGDSEVDEVSGGIWLAEGAKGAFSVKVRSAPAAKAVADALQAELAKTIEQGFNGALEDRRLAPVREFLKEMVIAADGKHIVIQSEVPGRVFTNAVK